MAGLVVVGVLLGPLGQIDLLARQLLVRDHVQQVRDRVEPGALLVVGADDDPGREAGVGRLEHPIAGARVVVPFLPRRQVHVTELPLPHRVRDPGQEPLFLLLVAHLEPELDQGDAAIDDVALELRAALQEPLVLLLRAEPHHRLDPGPVVPAAIEEHDLAGAGEVLHVALHVHLRLLAVGRRRQGGDRGTRAG